MKIPFGVALLGSIVAVVPARAEFQLAPLGLGATLSAQATPGPVNLLPESPSPVQKSVPPTVLPIAHGFGQQVPLAFATRQIVPARVKVTFGPDVNPAALVDWTGGRPWDEALRVAVRPLGLRVVVRWMAVSIVRS